MNDPDAAFVDTLSALANLSRLKLLRALRSPKILQEVQVPAAASDPRPLARQTVKEHLEKLVACGLVRVRDASRAHPATHEYTVNHQAFYALSEEVRGFARLKATVEPDDDTMVMRQTSAPDLARPALIVVKGLDEGASFHLGPKDDSPWVIGRRRGVDVTLDYDPFVSAENARIVKRAGELVLEDLGGSRNGTWLNFRRLPANGAGTLAHGDVIGVGRSLLVYWAERVA